MGVFSQECLFFVRETVTREGWRFPCRCLHAINLELTLEHPGAQQSQGLLFLGMQDISPSKTWSFDKHIQFYM